MDNQTDIEQPTYTAHHLKKLSYKFDVCATGLHEGRKSIDGSETKCRLWPSCKSATQKENPDHAEQEKQMYEHGFHAR